jgi:hypothetical protein
VTLLNTTGKGTYYKNQAKKKKLQLLPQQHLENFNMPAYDSYKLIHMLR